MKLNGTPLYFIITYIAGGNGIAGGNEGKKKEKEYFLR